ncbi:hypothetical protein EDC96DRAFT_573663 [Choanephora cucurbitarum]|nr:hypothetical protein EDC96DRAFT_573663 [Choanephora cucurbitarum]
MSFNKKCIENQKKPSLPPISSMDTFYMGESWNSVNSPTSPSIESLNHITMRMQENSIKSTMNDNKYRSRGSLDTLYAPHYHNQVSHSPLTERHVHQDTSFMDNTASRNYNGTLQLHQTEPKLVGTSSSSKNLSSLEEDIGKVILHCNCLSSSIETQRRQLFQENGNLTRPWLDDMIGKANEVLNALLRLRKIQLATEQRHHHQTDAERKETKPHDMSAKNPSTSGILSFSSGKYRRRGVYKRPVFQGRCHSCNISETPEWRRGPDGARTLCNACGLHYAKLSRKKNLQSNIKTTNSED